jgi:hypothetical protein
VDYKDINNTIKYRESGAHQHTCPYFKQNMWARQTDFYTQFKEHLQSIKNSNTNSKSAKHPHNNKYEFGPIEEIMDALHVINKGNHMNTLQKFYTYSKYKQTKKKRKKKHHKLSPQLIRMVHLPSLQHYVSPPKHNNQYHIVLRIIHTPGDNTNC